MEQFGLYPICSLEAEGDSESDATMQHPIFLFDENSDAAGKVWSVAPPAKAYQNRGQCYEKTYIRCSVASFYRQCRFVRNS